jgi:hypothetical protein
MREACHIRRQSTTHRNLGGNALPLTPTQKQRIRTAMTKFCVEAEVNQRAWHYSQQRPFHGYGQPASAMHVNDCSGYISLVFNHAMHKTGIYLADPLGYHYSGFGYTGSEVQWLIDNGHPAPENRYLVGDIAINGHSLATTDHTFICKKAGTSATSSWSSNGNENAPDSVKLHYHPVPLVGVWRHPALT